MVGAPQQRTHPLRRRALPPRSQHALAGRCRWSNRHPPALDHLGSPHHPPAAASPARAAAQDGLQARQQALSGRRKRATEAQEQLASRRADLLGSQLPQVLRFQTLTLQHVSQTLLRWAKRHPTGVVSSGRAC
jgi:hypothetical protein